MVCLRPLRKRVNRTIRVWLAFAFLLLVLGVTGAAEAARLSFRAYGASDGLSNLQGLCFTQTPAGYVLVCSDAGLFAYDGRRFESLGSAQGLTTGAVVEEITVAPDSRVAVRTPNQLFVSDQPISSDRPPSSLHFRAIELGDPTMFDRLPHRLVAWADGFVIASGRRTMRVSLATGAAALQPFTSPGGKALDNPKEVFRIRDRIWETFADGRVCSATARTVRCYGPREGLTHGPYVDLKPGPGTSVIARSPESLATIDGATGTVTEQKLPYQGGPYTNFFNVLCVVRMPSGELVTQSANGLMIRKSDGWHELQTVDGIPDGVISSMLVDAEGQLWVQLLGGGLYRGIGVGHWEAFQHDSGLSKGTVWAAVGAAKRSLWVSTDTGVDQVREVSGVAHVVRTLPGASFALGMSADGHVWTSLDTAGGIEIDPSTGAIASYRVPGVVSVMADPARAWFGTRTGLYVLDRSSKPGAAAAVDTSCGRVDGLAADDGSGVWMVCGGRLWRRHALRKAVRLGGLWPPGGFSPFKVWPIGENRVWLSGAGGLYEVHVAGDRIVSMTAVPSEDLGMTTEVFDVMVDHRGWVWAGTDHGLSVFNGRQWVLSNSTTGLLSDDVSENGLHEDEDGSVWIGTDRGLAHFLDPETLFRPSTVQVVVSQASLDGKIIMSGRHHYTTGALLLEFGTLSFAHEASTVFRYRLSGVDQGWVESGSGLIRYPSVPPGHHILTVVGYDTLTHAESKPVMMTIDIAYPWWRGWWAETIYGLLILGLLYGLLAARDEVGARKQRAKQLELEALVEERTRDMQLAQAELRRQATLDGLTGLLNRRELQARVAADLEKGDSIAAELVVAMIDVDHFKVINDRYGHLAGDDVLRALATRIMASLADGDYAGRYGGEEILVVIRDRHGLGMQRVTRLYRAVRTELFDIGDASIWATCSIGVGRASRNDNWVSLVGRADAALYHAKRSGRGCIVDSAGEIRREPDVMRVPELPLIAGGRPGEVLEVPVPETAQT